MSKTAPKFFLYRGEMRSMNEISRLSGKSYSVTTHRLKRGMDVDAPVDETRNPKSRSYRCADFDVDAEWSDECVDEVVRRHPGGITLDQIGKLTGVSRERVRQIQNCAMRKLRSARGLGRDMRVMRDAFEAMVESKRFDPWDTVEEPCAFYWSPHSNKKKAV